MSRLLLKWSSPALALPWALMACGQPGPVTAPLSARLAATQGTGSTDVVSGGIYKLINTNSGLALDVAGVSQASEAKVQVWAWGGGLNQQWKMEDAGGGYATLKAQHSGLCLDAQGGGWTGGTKVQQYTCNTTGAQQWKLVALGSGVFKLLNRNAGLALDVNDWGKTNGTGVQVATDNGSSAQQWTLERVDGGAGSGTTPSPTPTGGPWRERILNADGSINWSEYARVAGSYNSPEVTDYRFGPKYEDFHTAPEDLPTLWGPSSDGLIGGQACDDFRQGIDGQDWYAMSGQMIFSPDADAPSALQAGVVRARNGSTYTFSKYTPAYCFDLRFS